MNKQVKNQIMSILQGYNLQKYKAIIEISEAPEERFSSVQSRLSGGKLELTVRIASKEWNSLPVKRVQGMLVLRAVPAQVQGEYLVKVAEQNDDESITPAWYYYTPRNGELFHPNNSDL